MQASPLWARIPTALTPLIALVLALLLLVSSGCSRPKPAASGRPTDRPTASTVLSQGRLQEVAPPPATAAVAERLGERNPQVEIVAPADDSLLSDGPWTLQLKVSDWPLADAGSLGLGPHLVVQLDQQEPLRISSAAEAAAIAMPELQPGSHRITVYAARPWGEAVKSPGAMRQIRLHRVARNAAELPERGSAQLIVASPDGLQLQEPVLIDWLLLDAPLQHLRDDDARWRLRVSVNGDSFLVDRQTPLWLKGFRRGSNAVQLELLDGRGEPLNPPFNSVVREVVISSGERPAWQRPNLSGSELALLSGEPVAEPPAVEHEPAQAEPTAPAEAPAPVADGSAPAELPAAEPPQHDEQEAIGNEATPQSESPAPATVAQPMPEAVAEDLTSGLAASEAKPAPAAPETPEQELQPEAAPASSTEAAMAGREPAGDAGISPSSESKEDEALTPSEPAEAATPEEPEPPAPSPSAAAPTPDSAPTPPSPAATQAPAETSAPAPTEAPQDQEPPARISSGSSLAGSARDQVNADGSLLKPRPRGPLAGLREKLGG